MKAQERLANVIPHDENTLITLKDDCVFVALNDVVNVVIGPCWTQNAALPALMFTSPPGHGCWETWGVLADDEFSHP